MLIGFYRRSLTDGGSRNNSKVYIFENPKYSINPNWSSG
jgi:hypothetical protein